MLPALQPAMLLKLEDIFGREIDTRSAKEGSNSVRSAASIDQFCLAGWSRVTISPMVHEILGHLNGLVVLGEDFSMSLLDLRG